MGEWRRRIVKRLFRVTLVVAVAFAVVLPSLVVQPALRHLVRSGLNRPDLGLVCEKVTTDIGWWQLLVGDANVTVRGRCRELPFDVRTSLGFTWNDGPGLWFRARAGVEKTDWQILARGDAGWRGWQAEASLAEVAFSERDPLVAEAIGRFVPPIVSNLVVTGTVSGVAVASQLNGAKVVSWKARLPVRELCAACIRDGQPCALDGLALTPAASGLGAHVDVEPVFARARSLTVAGFSLTNLFAETRANAKDVTVVEAGAGCCGGRVRLYALHLDPAKLNGGFSLYLENVESGEVLRRFRGFQGDCSGPLNGKLSLFMAEGRRIRIRDAYLQSPSGATGRLRLDEASAVNDALALSGLDDAARANLRRALADLDYNVLKFDIRREAAHSLALNVRIEGTARRGKSSAPVSLNVTFRGDLEQLVNTGIRLTGTGKETKQ